MNPSAIHDLIQQTGSFEMYGPGTRIPVAAKGPLWLYGTDKCDAD